MKQTILSIVQYNTTIVIYKAQKLYVYAEVIQKYLNTYSL